MKRRTRIHYSDTQKAEMWDRWQRGESLESIGRLFDRNSSSIYGILSVTGGIRPPPRSRSRLALTLTEREEISHMSHKINSAGHNRKEDGQKADNSLRGNALRRALQQQVPTTLTPYEWEQWYTEHGIPEAHRQTDKRQPRRWWPLCKWF